ncbi:MAG TPA: hypothetical protein VME22_20900 [Solirubrobacteraceae bacterium]|nr:hypothetical protein [Solirubrobacteraceae bacterium]
MARFDYDVVIVGSRFGGSVATLRAARRATGSAPSMTMPALSGARSTPPIVADRTDDQL